MALKVENTIAFQKDQDLMEMKGEKETTVKMMMVWEPQAQCCGGGTSRESWEGIGAGGRPLGLEAQFYLSLPLLPRGSMSKSFPFSEPHSSHLRNGCDHA